MFAGWFSTPFSQSPSWGASGNDAVGDLQYLEFVTTEGQPAFEDSGSAHCH